MRKRPVKRFGNNRSFGEVPHKLVRYSKGKKKRTACDFYRVQTKKNSRYTTVLETTDEDAAIDCLLRLYGYA